MSVSAVAVCSFYSVDLSLVHAVRTIFTVHISPAGVDKFPRCEESTFMHSLDIILQC